MNVDISDHNQNPVSVRVIEALRSGVSAGSAIKALGSNQIHIVDAFSDRLLRSARGERSTGMILNAAFGYGKSHLLATLREIALERNYACSIVCVSKEMPLATIGALFSNSIRELRLPGKSVGGSCAEFVSRLNFNSREFASLLQDYSDDEDEVAAIFGGSLRLFESYQSQSDVLETIIDFWDGARCPIADIKRDLKAIGLPYQHLRAPREGALGLDRLQFVTNLLRAAGYAGWVLLIDEGEMIAKLSSVASRAKSYANLASLLGSPNLVSVAHLVTAVAITNDLWYELLTLRKDRETIDGDLRAARPELAEVALGALTYLREKERNFELVPMSRSELIALRSRIATIYGDAYPKFEVPAIESAPDNDDSRNVRSHLKEWITDWDLRRLYDGYVPRLSRRDAAVDLSENGDFTDSSPPDYD